MIEKAYAKINLCLNVLGVLDNGYHDLEMIMVPIDLYDTLKINISDEDRFVCNKGFLSTDITNNTVIKAITIIRKKYDIDTKFDVSLHKHIPSQAGLAGGSADAACAIRILNKLLKLNMSTQEMIDIATQVGADVPFCLFNKPAYVLGIGEKLNFIKSKSTQKVLLIKPRRGIPTKLAFKKLHDFDIINGDCKQMIKALETNDYQLLCNNLSNALEKPSMSILKDIRIIKEQLLELGFDNCIMTGSGSTVIAFTNDDMLIEDTLKIMKEKGYFVRVSKLIN